MVLATDRKYGDPISDGGYRIDNENGNKEDKSKSWTAAINAVKKTIEQSGHSLPPNAHYVVVEKGDCLWKIAEQYGESPEQLIADNGPLFKNPNLIHPNDVVIVRGTDGNAGAWTPAGGTTDPGTGTQQPASTDPQPGTSGSQPGASPVFGPPAQTSAPDLLTLIKHDSAQYDKDPSDQNRTRLETDVNKYLGAATSPGFADRVHNLTQIDCGAGSISKTIPTVVAKQMYLHRELPSTNLRSHAWKAFDTVLAALPESERKDAAQKMMQGLKDDETMKSILKDVAKDNYGIKL